MKGWILNQWITSPESRPIPDPTRSTMRITSIGGQPALPRDAAIIVDSATTEPTDRSIPPVRITKVMPTASTMRNALSTNRLSTTWPDAKLR